MAGMFRIRPAEPRRLRQQRGGRGHVTKQYPKQSDLSSCFPGAQGGCLPGLRSHGRRRVTVRDEPPQQPRQRRSGAPRGFQTPGPIGPAELLRGERRLVDDALRGRLGLQPDVVFVARTMSVSMTWAFTSASSPSRTACTAARNSGALIASAARVISGSSPGVRRGRRRSGRITALFP